MRHGDGNTTALIGRAAPSAAPPHGDRPRGERHPSGRLRLVTSLLAGLATAGVLGADGLMTDGRASVVRVVAGAILVSVSAGAVPPTLRPVARAVSGVALGAVAGLLAVVGGRSVEVSGSSARLVVLWGVALIVAARPHAIVRTRPPLLVVALVAAASAVLLTGALVTGAWTAIALIAAAAMPVATVLYLWPAATDSTTMLDDAALIAAVVGLGAVWLDDVPMTDALPFTLAVVAAAGVGVLSIVASEQMLRSVVAAATAGALVVLLAAPPLSTLVVVVIAAGVVWTSRRSAVRNEPVAVRPPAAAGGHFEAARRFVAVRSPGTAARTPVAPRVLGPVRRDAIDARPVTMVPEFSIDTQNLHHPDHDPDVPPADTALGAPNGGDLILADLIVADLVPADLVPADLVPAGAPVAALQTDDLHDLDGPVVEIPSDPVDPDAEEVRDADEVRDAEEVRDAVAPGTSDLDVAHYFDGLMGPGSSVTEPDEPPPPDRLGAALDQIERHGRIARTPHAHGSD